MAEQFEEAEEEVQLDEVITHQQELEDTANAVLGDSDDTNCSYSKVRVALRIEYKFLCRHTSKQAAGCVPLESMRNTRLCIPVPRLITNSLVLA